MTRTSLTILGATGSVGGSTLDVVSRHPERFSIHALTANRNDQDLIQLCRKHQPRFAVLLDENAAERAGQALRDTDVTVLCGPQALDQVASDPQVDQVMAAIVGAAGLAPTLAAARAGKQVLLANKEALVMSGGLFMSAVADNHAQVLPIDSEHNALFQCMPPGYQCGTTPAGVRRVLLTASGGPFLNTREEELEGITPDQACAHPNWDMGRKISVDSATLMNKGLEVIEAHWLFALPQSQIEVIIHPQSIVHSMVDYLDGSTLAQMGQPDMRTPIANALSWPDRIDAGVAALDLVTAGTLEFRKPELERFPCLALAFAALESGETAPAALNAANEVAVEAFLNGQIPFPAIPRVIERCLEQMNFPRAQDVQQIIDVDQHARQIARQVILTDYRSPSGGPKSDPEQAAQE